MTVNSAVPELIQLARTMRGDQWGDELGLALVAAKDAGWTWKRTLITAARLLADDKAQPRDMAAEASRPTVRHAGTEPNAEWHAAREALEDTC